MNYFAGQQYPSAQQSVLYNNPNGGLFAAPAALYKSPDGGGLVSPPHLSGGFNSYNPYHSHHYHQLETMYKPGYDVADNPFSLKGVLWYIVLGMIIIGFIIIAVVIGSYNRESIMSGNYT